MRWLPEERREGVAYIGSLLVHGDAPRDEHGFPFQVLIEYSSDDRALDLVTDEAGCPVAWVLDPTSELVRDDQGRAAVQPVPDDVADTAWAWLEDERRPSGDDRPPEDPA